MDKCEYKDCPYYDAKRPSFCITYIRPSNCPDYQLIEYGCNKTKADCLAVLEDIINSFDVCPNCPDCGFTVYIVPRLIEDMDGYTHTIPETEPEQCEFCYTNQNSIFNNKKTIDKIQEAINRIKGGE